MHIHIQSMLENVWQKCIMNCMDYKRFVSDTSMFMVQVNHLRAVCSSHLGIFEKQLASGQKLTIVGNGLQERDFVHVDDVVKKINIAVKTQDMDKYGEVYNVGTGKSISIIELANKISDNIEYVAPRDGEARYSCADITKIQSDYDWKPQKTLDEWIDEKLKFLLWHLMSQIFSSSR